jgi:short-subunit dehydrogenase
VITVKPGFVDTPMTEEFDKGLLWTQPETIAIGIKKAIEKHKSVVYLPWFWKWIMLVIKIIPRTIFKRLSI